MSVASSASVLYFSEEVVYPNNTSEDIQFTILPCPTFEEGSNLVMQRGAGMCTVKSTPERERAAIAFLKWLTEAQTNTRFVTSAGYMPVTSEAYERHLPESIEGLSQQKYVELYSALLDTQANYDFFTAPRFESYLETESAFEADVRTCLQAARDQYVASGGNDEELLNQLVHSSYQEIKAAFSH